MRIGRRIERAVNAMPFDGRHAFRSHLNDCFNARNSDDLATARAKFEKHVNHTSRLNRRAARRAALIATVEAGFTALADSPGNVALALMTAQMAVSSGAFLASAYTQQQTHRRVQQTLDTIEKSNFALASPPDPLPPLPDTEHQRDAQFKRNWARTHVAILAIGIASSEIANSIA